MEIVIQTIFWTLLWIWYGAYSAYQMSQIEESHRPITYVMFILVAPLILLIRLIIGVFTKHGLGRK